MHVDTGALLLWLDTDTRRPYHAQLESIERPADAARAERKKNAIKPNRE